MHECARVRQPQILHLMNQSFTCHAQFEFSAFLFSVGVPKIQRVQSAAKATAASFLPRALNKEKLNDSVLKVFCSFLNKFSSDAPRSSANAFYRRSQALGRNSAKLHSAGAGTSRCSC